MSDTSVALAATIIDAFQRSATEYGRDQAGAAVPDCARSVACPSSPHLFASLNSLNHAALHPALTTPISTFFNVHLNHEISLSEYLLPFNLSAVSYFVNALCSDGSNALPTKRALSRMSLRASERLASRKQAAASMEQATGSWERPRRWKTS